MELRADLVNQTSPSQAKIALFRSLFRGREDVYPRRFEDVSHPISGGERRPFAQRRAWVMRSADGGSTFSMPLFMNDACGPPPTFQLSALAIDTSAGPFRDRLYFACRQAAGGPIVVSSSGDRGESWSIAVAVDGGSRPESEYRIPAIAVDGRGVLAVAWLERRAKTGELCQDLHFTASLDGGRTFLPEQRLSGAPCLDSAANDAFDRFPTNGDYFGLISTGPGRFRLVWSETRDDATSLLTILVDVEGTVVVTKP